MNQQEKQLLLKDICARLPYNVICKLSAKGADISITEKLDLGGLEHFMFGTMDVKPYLRPMSSMTKEELSLRSKGFNSGYEYYDWLNAHHFDYRGLIRKGLALEAPEGMYKTE